jgi:hypothetical protein
MEKEQWKDEVLNSLKGLKPAEPNAFLFTRIEARLQKPVVISGWQLGIATIVLVLMLMINALIVFRTERSMQPVNQEYRISGFQSL